MKALLSGLAALLLVGCATSPLSTETVSRDRSASEIASGHALYAQSGDQEHMLVSLNMAWRYTAHTNKFVREKPIKLGKMDISVRVSNEAYIGDIARLLSDHRDKSKTEIQIAQAEYVSDAWPGEFASVLSYLRSTTKGFDKTTLFGQLQIMQAVIDVEHQNVKYTHDSKRIRDIFAKEDPRHKDLDFIPYTDIFRLLDIIKPPRVTWTEGRGDCDEFANDVSKLGRHMGLQTYPVDFDLHPNPPKTKRHGHAITSLEISSLQAKLLSNSQIYRRKIMRPKQSFMDSYLIANIEDRNFLLIESQKTAHTGYLPKNEKGLVDKKKIHNLRIYLPKQGAVLVEKPDLTLVAPTYR